MFQNEVYVRASKIRELPGLLSRPWTPAIFRLSFLKRDHYTTLAFLKKGGHMPFCGATNTVFGLLVTSTLGFKARVDFSFAHFLACLLFHVGKFIWTLFLAPTPFSGRCKSTMRETGTHARERRRSLGCDSGSWRYLRTSLGTVQLLIRCGGELCTPANPSIVPTAMVTWSRPILHTWSFSFIALPASKRQVRQKKNRWLTATNFT